MYDATRGLGKKRPGQGMDASDEGDTSSPGASVLRGHSQAVYGVDVSPDAQLLLSCSGDGTVRLWSAELGANLVAYRWAFEGLAHPARAAATAAAQCHLARSGLQCLAVWAVALLCALASHCMRLQGISHQGFDVLKRMLIADASGVLESAHDCYCAAIVITRQQFPVSHAGHARKRRGHGFPVWDVAWAPAGHYFGSAGADRTARLWCTERARQLRLLAGHHADVSALIWHPNSHTVATGSDDRTVRLWDVRDGSPRRILVGHRAPVRRRTPPRLCPFACYCVLTVRCIRRQDGSAAMHKGSAS